MTAEPRDVKQERSERLETLAGRSHLGQETMDLEALILSVMQSTAKDATRELAAIMAEMEATTAQRRRLRQAIREWRSIRDRRERGRADAEAALEALKAELASLSELGEAESLRLQSMMDRRAKFLETLGNLLKKASQTQDKIVSNLK